MKGLRPTESSALVKVSVSGVPEGVGARWWTALQDAAVVDARHLVLVFHVDVSSSILRGTIPEQLTKYSETEDHAPYHAACLKLATLRHYREQHTDLEGTGDSMEGRSRITSTLEEMCRRHGAHNVPHGAHLVTADVTYQTDDTSLIYCTSRARNRAFRHQRWRIESRIHDVPKLALHLGAEFANQRGEGRRTNVPALDWLLSAAVGRSGLDSVVRVYHGPVFYDDNAGEALFTRFPEHARGLAAHFFKRTTFEDQREYRFVLSAQGGRPADDEFYLRITPELRSVFRRPVKHFAKGALPGRAAGLTERVAAGENEADMHSETSSVRFREGTDGPMDSGTQ